VSQVWKATDVGGQLATKKKVYLRAIPIDPVTGKQEWDLRSCYDGPDVNSWGGENVFDVHSKSKRPRLNGENTVTGSDSSKKEKVKRQKYERQSRPLFTFYLLPFAFPRRQRGFTLLELMIVITIIIILAAIALPQYQKSVKQAREAVLHEDLFSDAQADRSICG